MISGALEPRGSGLGASETDETIESVDVRRTVTDELLLSRIVLSAGILIIDDDVALMLFSLIAAEVLEKLRIPIADVLLFPQLIPLSDNLVKLAPIACGLVLSDRPDGMLDALRLSRALPFDSMSLNRKFFADLAGSGMSLAIILQRSRMIIKILGASYYTTVTFHRYQTKVDDCKALFLACDNGQCDTCQISAILISL